jgi:hypothetical protein
VGSFLFKKAIKTMASRFVVADNDVIEKLQTSCENVNTSGVFKKWNWQAGQHYD